MLGTGKRPVADDLSHVAVIARALGLCIGILGGTMLKVGRALLLPFVCPLTVRIGTGEPSRLGRLLIEDFPNGSLICFADEPGGRERVFRIEIGRHRANSLPVPRTAIKCRILR